MTDQPVHLDFGAPSTESIPPRTPGRVRLGVMGGTFDPIHHGHLVAASEVAAVFDLRSDRSALAEGGGAARERR